MVSSESPSSVEYGIKKIFFIFASFQSVNDVKIFVKKQTDFRCFYSHFPELLAIFLSVWLKYVKIVLRK